MLKSDGSIRVCGDYKVTLNPELQVDQHPMLTMRDIFASLGGSQYFSKIDLSQAFNQIELSPESWRLTTINTIHLGGCFSTLVSALGLQIARLFFKGFWTMPCRGYLV